MKTRRSMRTAAALLALLVVTAGLPGPARAQDELPDLQIEIVGLSPNNPRQVLVRVTNVSDFWSEKTEATVEPVAPTPGVTQTFRVPDLNTKKEVEKDPSLSFQFEHPYDLAADCQPGHKLRAKVSAGANWDGKPEPETKLGNNVAERELCPAAAQPAPQPAPAANAPVVVPLSPSVARSATAQRTALNITPDTKIDYLTGPDLLVGWGQEENKALLGSDTVWVSQTAVKFDLSQVQPGIVDTATLSFREDPLQWTNGAGENVHKAGCVAAIGAATTDWAGAGNFVALFPNELIDSSPPGRKEWNVKLQVVVMMNNPQDPSVHRGFVLMGEKNLDGLTGEDDTRCRSKLSEISLNIGIVPRMGR